MGMMSFGMKPDIDYMVNSSAAFVSEYDQVTQAEAGTASGATSAAAPLQPYRPNAPPHVPNTPPPLMQTISSAGSVSLQASHLDFSKAEIAWKSNKEQLSGKAGRALWAYYQQATVGDCNMEKPSGKFNGNAKEQWRLWNGLQGVPPEDAKIM